jgi:phosphoribosylaminoimidazolecarboxamide formyltransferase/IMP cyclohydrolase
MDPARPESEDRPVTDEARNPIRRALISVSDKTSLDDLARGLHAAGVEIVSTGSTAARITAVGVPVTPVERLTGFPEALDGRVKTLHPRVHAGLLADRRRAEHRRQLDDLEIEAFDLLVANFYPFARSARVAGATPDEVIEQIDIGGPAMVRAAAKNHASVAVAVDPAVYPSVLEAVRAGGFTLAQRRRLAAVAFRLTATYDLDVAQWFARELAPDEVAAETGWPEFAAVPLRRRAVLRYGENPHQRAAFYTVAGNPDAGDAAEAGENMGLDLAEQLHGKEMSYNNYVDADAAWRAVGDFAEPAVAIIKHTNPCGLAIGADIARAHHKAHACDPVSAFGGVIAANRPVSPELARQIAEVFTEVVIAPDFDARALAVLTAKRNIRLLRCPRPQTPLTQQTPQTQQTQAQRAPRAPSPPSSSAEAGRPPVARGWRDIEWRALRGGALAQTVDRIHAPGDDPAAWELKAGTAADPATLRDLAFAWRACRSVKSNAILLAADGATVGVGMGQVNRVDSARLAVGRAGERAAAAVAASDAFFPFPDGLEVLAEAGVRAIVEPGGSLRDDEVVAAAERAGVTLYFTGVRHFFH